MREAYIGLEPNIKGQVVELSELSLIFPFEEMVYIAYGHNEVPDFSPQNFILILDSATGMKEKKLKELGYKIHKKEFQNKRIFTDNNRQELFNDLKKLEPLHLYMIGKNAEKIPDFNLDLLSQTGSLIYSVNNDFVKAAIVFGVKPSKTPIIRY